MSLAIPTPQSQLEFLLNLQRLLADGSKNTTYKLALLRALIDLSLSKRVEGGDPLDLRLVEISEIFVRVYWRQVSPFPNGHGVPPKVLVQRSGRDAAILNWVKAEQGRFGAIRKLQREKEWERLIQKVSKKICQEPLWKLQRVGKGEVLDFLYEQQEGEVERVHLKPGVAYCLRSFYPTIRNLIEGSWADFVAKANAVKFGHSADLREFLFGVSRASLDEVRRILIDVDGVACHYCEEAAGRAKTVLNPLVVDHFIPWSRYQVDLGHNFVLAHKKCNSYKGDQLPTSRHLWNWLRRNRDKDEDLQKRFESISLGSDMMMSVNIARWAYDQTKLANGLVWDHGKTLVPLGDDWFGVFRYVRP